LLLFYHSLSTFPSFCSSPFWSSLGVYLLLK
jgi:hypothetical protein